MRFFLGHGTQMGIVAAATQTTFAALCVEVIETPVCLPFTTEAFFAQTEDQQNAAKRVAYLTPATWPSSPTQRSKATAEKCNLVALDIDDAKEACRLLKQNWATTLGELAFIVWHTVRSTKAAPRLRLIVSAESIPVDRYVQAARTVADLIGMTTVTSGVTFHAVQPMFLPTIFEDTEGTPIIASNTGGEPFRVFDIVDEDGVSVDSSPAVSSGNIADLAYLRTPLEGIILADAASALAVLDPDMSMQPWIETGAALKHQFDSAEAFKLWDEWSAKGKKYTGTEDTRYRWNSLRAQPTDRAPVTIRSLFKQAQARGWVNEQLTKRQNAELMGWLRHPGRSSEELLDQGVKRIAKVSPVVGQLERKVLLNTLRTTLDARGLPMTLTDLRGAVRQLELDAAKTSGVAPWAKGLCFVTARNEFYKPSTDRHFSPEVLDLMFSSPSLGEEKPMRPREYAIQIANVPQVENLRYDPTQGEKRFCTLNGIPYVNTYRASYAPPEPDRADEAGELWWAHLCNLIAEPQWRRTLMDILAYPVQHPGMKIRWAPLIQSAEGAGKTVIADALKAVLGSRNVSKLSGADILNGSWTDWAYGKQVVVMEEVRVIGHNRHAIMDKLKPLITDDDVGLQQRFQDHRTVENVTNYLMFTNYQDALAVNDDGRRYFVLRSPLQKKEDILALGGDAYFDKLYGMIAENPGGLRAWFQKWKLSPDFKPNGRAPVTPYLRELSENAASPLATAVRQAIEDEDHPLVRKDLLSIGCLRGALDGSHLQDFSDQGLAAVLRELGWRKFDRVTVDGAKHQLWTHGDTLPRDVRGVAEARVKYL